MIFSEWKNREKNRGFTLIELMVVAALIGLVLMVSYPRFSGLIQGRKLMGFCGELAGTMDYIRARAVLDGRIYYFHFDRTKQEYWVTREGEEEEQEPMEGRLGTRRSFPPYISLKKVEVERDVLSRSAPAIRFYPRGSADEALIYLETEKSDRASIRVKPFTGRSEVYNYFFRG